MQDALPDLNALARFAAVVEHGGFSPASRALGLPRQALHRSVARIEEDAGVLLLDRGSRGVRPTDAGKRVFEHAKELLVAAQHTRATLRAAHDQPRGVLRIGAPALIGELWLADLIRDFLRRWPDVRVQFESTPEDIDLLSADIDLCVSVFRGDNPDYFTVRVGQSRLILCATANYLADAPELAQPSDLERHSIISYGRNDAPLPWEFKRSEVVEKLSPNPRLLIDSFRAVMSATLDHLGVALLPYRLCAEELRAGRLLRVLPEWRPPVAPLWATYASRAEGSPALLAFLELMKEAEAYDLATTAVE